MFKKYDVVFEEELSNKDGSVQSGFRPSVVIQNDIGNKYSPTLIVLPLTSKIKNLRQATHLLIKSDAENGLTRDSMLLAEQVTTVSKEKIKRIGRISDKGVQNDIFRCYIYAAAYGEGDEDLQNLKI